RRNRRARQNEGLPLFVSLYAFVAGERDFVDLFLLARGFPTQALEVGHNIAASLHGIAPNGWDHILLFYLYRAHLRPPARARGGFEAIGVPEEHFHKSLAGNRPTQFADDLAFQYLELRAALRFADDVSQYLQTALTSTHCERLSFPCSRARSTDVRPSNARR